MKLKHHLSAEILDGKASLAEIENLCKNARALGFAEDDDIQFTYHVRSDRDWITLEVRKK